MMRLLIAIFAVASLNLTLAASQARLENRSATVDGIETTWTEIDLGIIKLACEIEMPWVKKDAERYELIRLAHRYQSRLLWSIAILEAPDRDGLADRHRDWLGETLKGWGLESADYAWSPSGDIPFLNTRYLKVVCEFQHEENKQLNWVFWDYIAPVNDSDWLVFRFGVRGEGASPDLLENLQANFRDILFSTSVID